MISIHDLCRNYGEVRAVDSISLEIERGEVVGLLGHNGAGKTTVMKLLTGYLEPSSGSVQVGGVEVAAQRAAAQRQIGYLPENAPLYPELAVQEYLQMMAALRGVPTAEIDRAVLRAAHDTALEDRLGAPIHTLSKGYRQRVGLAQAIVHSPEVLVLDEPTNGLDPAQIQAIRDLIRRLARRTTIILSTHILQEIEAVCDRVVVMIQGRIAADGRLADVLASRTVALSLAAGSPAATTARLSAIAGVVSVRALGADADNPGFARFELDCAPGQNPVPAAIELARDAGWRIAGAALQRDSLEAFFARLHERHAGAAVPERAA